MKTKLELNLAVQAAAVETLDAKPADADKRIDGLLTPLNLAPAERDRFSQLFYSRRQALSALKDVPLELAEPAAKPGKK